jgi:membrane protease YdiL (CAAX protease family)
MAKRIIITMLCFIVPIALLGFGIYGTFIFTFSIPLIWQMGVLGEDAGSLGLRRSRLGVSLTAGILSGLVIAIAGGFALKAAGIAGYSLDKVADLNGMLQSVGINITVKNELGFRLLASDGSVKGWILSLIYSVFLIGLGEEIFWRGFIQGKMSNILSANTSIWITAGIYGLVHSYLLFIVPPGAGAVLVALIAILGAFWGYLYKYSGNIWAPALSHGLTAFIVWKYFVFTGV